MSAQPLPSWLKPADKGWMLALHVQPGARRTEVQGAHDGALKLRLAAPPVDGKANAELLRFLGERLGVARRSVSLASGQASRHKRILLDAGLQSDVILSALWDDDRLGPLG